jgi:PAS domain S-box-containing protein
VIYLTAHTEENLLPQAKVTMPFGYLFKPVKENDLHTAIEIALYRHTLEQALRESEKFSSSLLNNSPNPILVINSDSTIRYVNPALEGLTGFSSVELIGKQAPYPWCTEETQQHSDLDKNMSEGGQRIEELFQKKTGEQFLVEITYAPVKKNGELLYYIASWVNITERKIAEDAFERSQKDFRNLAENSSDTIIVTDIEGYVLFVNPAGLSLLDRKAEELLGELFGFPLITGKSTEIDIIRKDGAVRIGEMRVAETDWAGRRAYLIAIHDITERKRYEEKLQASLREKETLMREIHHRVKNNLQIISSLLNMQAMKATDEEVIESLLDSRGRIQTMSLIHTLLYQSENLEQVDMGVTLRKLVNFQLELYGKEAKEIASIVSAQGIILPISQAIPCGLIINELVSNALKHAFKGMGSGRIDVSMRADEDMITLSVKDNGVGIPEDVDIYAIGSLGLPLVRSLAEEQLHGKVKLNQEGGTEICIEFNKIMGNDT